METRQGSINRGIVCALFLAGPVFVLMAVAAMLYGELPQPIVLPLGEMEPVALLILPISSGFGVILSLPLIVPASLAGALLGDRYACFRPKGVWAGVGGLLGFIVSEIVHTPKGEIMFALISTSVICAILCRHWVYWAAPPPTDEDFFYR